MISRLAAVDDQGTALQEQISSLLHEAGETHHRVFRIVDGSDDDWASWYADWLINLSELPALLGVKPVRSELTYLLVTALNLDLGRWMWWPSRLARKPDPAPAELSQERAAALTAS